MKTENLFRTAIFAVFALIMTGLASCTSDDDLPIPAPKDPEAETEPELSYDWSKVTFTFHVGHLHGTSFHGNPVNEEVQYYKSLQEYTIEVDENGDLTYSDTPIRFLKNQNFALEIDYYDSEGKLLNTEYAAPENSPHYQHFFLTKNATHIDSDNPFENADNILGYTYRDTDPIDINIKDENHDVVLRDNDPLGFKGYFFVNEIYTKFDLNVILVHLEDSDKYKTDGSAYAFNQPDPTFLNSKILDVNIPVRVYTSTQDYDMLVNDLANEFNINVEEAEDDINLQWDTPFEDGNFWM
ncbi:hypothetical protein GO491_06235 [Flavobacteriaceae bacterium Ap0902]|nr:hypothetical protein [Flavobacteriaceae bacterium Ap0902]